MADKTALAIDLVQTSIPAGYQIDVRFERGRVSVCAVGPDDRRFEAATGALFLRIGDALGWCHKEAMSINGGG